jgi:hypothetical protein
MNHWRLIAQLWQKKRPSKKLKLIKPGGVMKRLEEMGKMELADLTDDQVQRLIDLELAHSGLVRMAEPEKVEVPESTKMNPIGRVYKVMGSDIGFSSEEDARKFFELKPIRLGYSWPGAEKLYYIDSPRGETIDIISVFDKTLAENVGNGPAERVWKINESAKEKYRQNYKQVSDVATDVWNRIIESREFKREVNAARAALDKYIVIVEGDEIKARKLFYLAYKSSPDIMVEVVGPGPVCKPEGNN